MCFLVFALTIIATGGEPNTPFYNILVIFLVGCLLESLFKLFTKLRSRLAITIER